MCFFLFVLVLVLRKSERDAGSDKARCELVGGKGRRLGAQATPLLQKGTPSCTPPPPGNCTGGVKGAGWGPLSYWVAVVPSAGPITGVSSSWTRHIGLWPRCGRP